jgi:hypothetical protein
MVDGALGSVGLEGEEEVKLACVDGFAVVQGLLMSEAGFL